MISMEQDPLSAIVTKFRPIIIIVGIASFVTNILHFVPALYMIQIYDRVLNSRNIDTLIALSAIAVFLYAITCMIEWARSQIMIRLGNNIDLTLSSKLFNAAIDQALANIPSVRPSDVFSDLLIIRQFLTGSGILNLFDVPWIFISLAILFWVHPIAGVFGTASTAILVVLGVSSEILNRKYVEQSSQQARMAHRILDSNLRNAELIEAMGMRENLMEYWLPAQKKMLAYQTISSERSAVLEAIIRFTNLTLRSLILGVAAWLVIKGELTAGSVIGCSIILGRALGPINGAISTWKLFILTRNAWKRLSAVLKASAARHERKLRLLRPEGHISVSNVHVIPPGGTTAVLKGISFEIGAGEVLAIVGPSASGKSSLAKVIVGVWKPYIGTVRIDGADISQWNKSELGASIGYLPQEVGLLTGSVAFNIARAGSIMPEKVIEAAKLAHAHEMILSLSKGYNTDLSTVNLSGGQKQRIALARALYNLPSLIVLDEPDAHLDGAGEEALIASINNLRELGKTVIVITHRPAVLSIVDKIAVIMNGKLVAFGPRDAIFRPNEPNAAPDATNKRQIRELS